jgi:predicted RNase H-like HicB family nuclease
MSQFNQQIASFGKIFIKEGKDIPALPDMKLIVLKTDDGYQAVCVDLEIDSVGETIKAACDNLKEALIIYTKMAIDHFDNTDDAVKDIVRIAYSAGGQQKGELLDLYLKAKRDYIMRRVEEKKKAISRADELKVVIFRLFQAKPIEYTLQPA